MKKKIVGIFVMTLLITTALPVIGVPLPDKTNGEVLDQVQESQNDCKQLFAGDWQEFYPIKNKLVRVEIKISQTCDHCPDLTMEIQKPLGIKLTSVSVPAKDIPWGYCLVDWVSFDFPDISVTPGENYFIRMIHDVGEYYWAGHNGNPYPKGDSVYGTNWDYCFRTYAEKSKTRDLPRTVLENKAVNPLFLKFLEQHLNLFPILQRLLLRLGL